MLTLDGEIIKRGYKPYPSIVVPKESLVNMLRRLDEITARQGVTPIHQMSLKDAMYDVNYFFNTYYVLHNVPYLTTRKIGPLTIPRIQSVYPTELPLYNNETDEVFDSELITTILRRTNKIVFNGIKISPTITEQTSSSIVHEITHTQLESVKHSIRNYYNSEILSIFNELLHASLLSSDEKILHLNDARRMYEMRTSAEEIVNKEAIYREDLLFCNLYLISDLKAYNLFIKYYYGSTSLKKEILFDIQSVFNGYITVEDLLRKYEVTYQNSQDEKTLTKYLTR